MLAIYKQDALAGLCRVVNQVATSGPLKNITERRFNGNIVWCQCTSRLIAITVIQHTERAVTCVRQLREKCRQFRMNSGCVFLVEVFFQQVFDS